MIEVTKTKKRTHCGFSFAINRYISNQKSSALTNWKLEALV